MQPFNQENDICIHSRANHSYLHLLHEIAGHLKLEGIIIATKLALLD